MDRKTNFSHLPSLTIYLKVSPGSSVHASLSGARLLLRYLGKSVEVWGLTPFLKIQFHLWEVQLDLRKIFAVWMPCVSLTLYCEAKQENSVNSELVRQLMYFLQCILCIRKDTLNISSHIARFWVFSTVWMRFQLFRCVTLRLRTLSSRKFETEKKLVLLISTCFLSPWSSPDQGAHYHSLPANHHSTITVAHYHILPANHHSTIALYTWPACTLSHSRSLVREFHLWTDNWMVAV
jgi:hypothetical protein